MPPGSSGHGPAPLATMAPPPIRFYFDIVDPLSYLSERELRLAEVDIGAPVERVPVELWPAPRALTDTHDPFWAPRWAAAAEVLGDDREDELQVPHLIPRSRKAHELFLHASAKGVGAAAVERLQKAFFVEGRDIGRVDVLVEVGRALGLDHTETKAVLDVDKFEADAARHSDEARARGIVPPALVLGDRSLEGFHNRAALGTFLAAT